MRRRATAKLKLRKRGRDRRFASTVQVTRIRPSTSIATFINGNSPRLRERILVNLGKPGLALARCVTGDHYARSFNERVVRKLPRSGTGRRVSAREACGQFALSFRNRTAGSGKQGDSWGNSGQRGGCRELRH